MSDRPQSTATHPASVAPADVKGKPAWRRWLVIAAATTGVAAAAGLLLRGEPVAKPTAATLSHVPRIEAGRIHYSDDFAQRAGLRVVEARAGALLPEIAAVGTVAFDAEHVAAVGTRLRGLVSRVAKFEGDAVDAGAVLAQLDSAELGEAQASVSTLEAEKEAAELNAGRETRLAERSLTTAREVEQAAVEAKKATLLLGAAKQKVSALAGRARGSYATRLGAHDVRSPIKGTVVERNVAPGQFVDGELVAFKVANLDHLWIELDVFERNLARISVGDEAELLPLSGQGQPLLGRVAKIGAQIDQQTHSAKVRIAVANRDRRLRVGQAVQAKIHSTAGAPQTRPIIPTRAITFVDGQPTVFVLVENNVARAAKVELGGHDHDETEIVRGLDAGDRVVAEGAFALKSELFR